MHLIPTSKPSGGTPSKLLTVSVFAAVLGALWSAPAMAQPKPVGPTKTLVNTDPAPLIGNDIAYDPGRDIYLGVIGYGPVFGAFSTETGDLIASFRITAPASTSFAHYPKVAYSPHLNAGNGAFLVTWHQNDGAPNFVHSVVVAYPSGVISADQTVSGEFQGGTLPNAGGASVAYSKTSNRFLVVWTTGARGVQGRFVDGTTGLATGAVMQLVDAPPPSDGHSHAEVTWNPVTDEFGLSYAGWNSSAAFVGFKRVRASDGLVSAPTSFAFSAGTFVPDIEVNPATGNYIIGWSRGAGTLGTEFDRNGTMIGPAGGRLLSSRVGTPVSFSMAFNPVSGTILAVSEDTQSFNVGGTELDGSGMPLDAGIAVTSESTASWVPRVTARTEAREWNVSTSRRQHPPEGGGGVTLANQIVASGSGPRPLSVTIAANKSTPVTEGTAITWTATASGGTAPIQYQFWRFSPATGWAVAQAYSASNTFTWVPTAGTHAVQVWARNSGSTEPYDAYAPTGTFTVTPPVARISSFTSNVTFPSAPNVTATWTAQASVAGGSVEYQFWRFTQGSGWTMIQNWSPINSFTWIVSEGTHAIQVWARRVGSTERLEDWRGTNLFTVVSTPARLTGLTANVTFPTAPATPVTWTATGTGGNGPLEYKFWLFNAGTASWSVLRDWASSNQVTWTPGANTGANAVQAWVRSAGFTGSYEDWRGTDFFNVTASTGLTLTANTPLNGRLATNLVPMTFTAQMAGPGAWEYRFWTFSTSTGWVAHGTWMATNQFQWFPPAGTNALQVWARQAGSNAKYERWETTGFFVVNP